MRRRALPSKRRTVRATALAACALVALGTAGSAGAACRGDCNGDGRIEEAEVKDAVRIALDGSALVLCDAADVDRSGRVTVDELVLTVGSRFAACGDATDTPTPTATSTPSPTPSPAAQPTVPTNARDLLDWLQAGGYREWHAESAIHASAGPHFGRVRTFLNDAVFDSLEAGRAQHPAGAALVKELYGVEGDVIQGWSVMVKTQADSDGGRGWFWFERFGLSTFAAGNGIPLCYGCHGSSFGGLTNRDYVLSPFPLQ